jgi:pimeloyl-ACP methyl ester carboxylesterase
MTTFVLTGGAWIGAWAWRDVSERLRTLGHRVYPLSLTGLAERVHLAGPNVDLDTHITDVLNLFEFEDLTDVVLVGHSYAGAVITGVADRVPKHLKALVYCDAGPLGNGQRMLDLLPPEQQEPTRRDIAEHGDGWRMAFPGFPALGNGASLTGVGEAERALMQRHAVDHPFGTYTQPLRLQHAEPGAFERVVIVCEDGQRFLEFMKATLGGETRYLELDTGHWPMLSRPADLAALLQDIR